ncbi:hypothetical protein ACFO0N_15820 [Halobium salinum]|uniref:Uncharacterized protein n=1 Tax=Halobium salinum TaxID=1364940 RepID=A0ABD5PFJ0_9EURY|nr:hypothetical protein [Halobium salinum]
MTMDTDGEPDGGRVGDGSVEGPSLRREARATLDAQLDALAALDRKALRLLQFTAAVVSAVAAVLSLASGPATVRAANAYVATGVGALLLAALTATTAYAATPRVVGLDADGLERALALSGAERTEALVRGYAEWIRYNAAANRRAGFAVTVASLLVAGATVALGLGVVRAFGGPLPVVVPVLAAVAFVVSAALAGVHRQARRVVAADGPTERPEVPAGRISPQSMDTDSRPLSGQRVGPADGRDGE